jgi:hypothetical protein
MLLDRLLRLLRLLGSGKLDIAPQNVTSRIFNARAWKLGFYRTVKFPVDGNSIITS